MTFQELGQSIREKREAIGLSIDDVAARIKISGRILRSIEEGSLTGLPHTVYTKSFTRSFGLLVGYDAAELSAALEEVFPDESLDESRAESVLVKNASESYPGTLRRIIALMAALVLLAGIGTGIWYVSAKYGEQIIDMVKQPFSAKIPAEGEPAPPAGNSTDSSAVDNAFYALMHNATLPPSGEADAQALSGSLPAPPSPAQAGVAASNTGQASSFPAAFPGDSASGGENPVPEADGEGASGQSGATADAAPDADGKNQLLLTCVESCWISSRADGARGRDYTLKPGESFVLTYKDSLELTLGNAGGVKLEHNGKSLGVAGRRGQRLDLRFPVTH